MNTHRILILSLLATGCAATADPGAPAQETPRFFGPVDAPHTEFVAAEAPQPGLETPASLDDLSFRLTPPPSDAALPTSAQEAAAASPAPESPHGFSGGVGIRIRGGESALDLTAQYHYYVNPKLDIGAIADWALSPIDSFLIAPAAWWHPNDRLTLFGAPGIEFVSSRGGNAALRVGGSYRLPLGKLAVRPFGWIDFVVDRKDSFSLGIAIGV